MIVGTDVRLAPSIELEVSTWKIRMTIFSLPLQGQIALSPKSDNEPQSFPRFKAQSDNAHLYRIKTDKTDNNCEMLKCSFTCHTFAAEFLNAHVYPCINHSFSV